MRLLFKNQHAWLPEIPKFVQRSLVITVLLFISAKSTFAQDSNIKRVFAIPTYPGLEAFNSYSSDLATRDSPFRTILKVFRTKKRETFNTELVIKFYESYLSSRGWKKGLHLRKDNEPYLEMDVQVYEQGGSQADIQVAATLYLWLAPKDGMLTAYLHEWRNSSLRPAAESLFNETVARVKKTSEEIKYNFQEGSSELGMHWIELYENEYLVAAKDIILIDKLNEKRSCDSIEGRIYVTVLAYKDGATAEQEVRTAKERDRRIIQRDNLLVFIDNRDPTQASIVDKLVEQLSNNQITNGKK